MKMLNKISKSETPRWDIMKKLDAISADIDRLTRDLNEIGGKKDEVDMIAAAYWNVRHAMMKINNHRDGELNNA